MRDVIDFNEIQGEIGNLYDLETGLPKRALFCDRLHRALLLARREDLRVSLMLVELDAADLALPERSTDDRTLLVAEVGTRLTGALRASDSAGRLEPCLFAVMLPHAKEDGVPLVAGRIVVSLMKPFELGGSEVQVRTSVGIAFCDDPDVTGPGELLAQAFEAMGVARSKGGGFEVHTMAADDAAREDVVRALKSA